MEQAPPCTVSGARQCLRLSPLQTSGHTLHLCRVLPSNASKFVSFWCICQSEAMGWGGVNRSVGPPRVWGGQSERGEKTVGGAGNLLRQRSHSLWLTGQEGSLKAGTEVHP